MSGILCSAVLNVNVYERHMYLCGLNRENYLFGEFLEDESNAGTICLSWECCVTLIFGQVQAPCSLFYGEQYPHTVCFGARAWETERLRGNVM